MWMWSRDLTLSGKRHRKDAEATRFETTTQLGREMTLRGKG